MKIKSIKHIKLEREIPVYDVVNATPGNNFLVQSGDRKVSLHNCGLLDEVDFVKGANVKMEQSKIMKVYNSVKRRMESRYMRRGELPGILFLVSSKKSQHDFLESYSKTQVDNEHVLIVDEPLWKVKPSDNYCGKYFYVAVGNNYVKSKIINESTEDLDAYRSQGYNVIEVPVEHRDPFEIDIDAALMDIAGIATTSKSKFISYDRLKRNYTDRINPFKTEVLTIGMDDNFQVKDFFAPLMISPETRGKPGFIHIDTSLTGDNTGLSYVVIDGTKDVKKYKKSEDNEVSVENEFDLVFRQVFTIGISAPADSEISFEKTRQFIYYLKNELGFNLKEVSCDGYQSRDTIQQLTTAGISAKLISLDKAATGYLTFKAAINEERLDLLNLTGSIVEREAIELERDGITGKIDHPPASEGGSKDEVDSLCGAIYLASLYKYASHIRYAAEDAKIMADNLQSDAELYFGQTVIQTDNGEAVTAKSTEDLLKRLHPVIYDDSEDLDEFLGDDLLLF